MAVVGRADGVRPVRILQHQLFDTYQKFRSAAASLTALHDGVRCAVRHEVEWRGARDDLLHALVFKGVLDEPTPCALFAAASTLHGALDVASPLNRANSSSRRWLSSSNRPACASSLSSSRVVPTAAATSSDS